YQFQLVSYRGTLNEDAVFGALSNVAPITTEPGSDSEPDEEPEPDDETDPDEETDPDDGTDPDEEPDEEPEPDDEPAPRSVKSVKGTPGSRTFADVGQTARLPAVGYDVCGDAAEGAEFTFVCSNPSVVSVSSTGLMTARSAGTATIVVASV